MVADFSRDFDGSVKAAFGALMAATKAANRLPSDISFHRTLDETIDTRLKHSGQKALDLANKLWTKARSNAADLEISSIDDIAMYTDGQWDAAPGFRTVVDAVDSLLEKIDVGLDEVLQRPAHNIRANALQGAPVVTSVAAANGSVRLVHANNVARPQLLFKDAVDNSASTPFVWKIREKPHALVPLEYGLPGDAVRGTPLGQHLASMGIRSGTLTPGNEAVDTGDGVHFDMPHPYEYEIKHQPVASQLFEETEPVEPASWDDTPFEFVDTEEQLNRMMEHLEQAEEVAIDLEHHNYRSYQGFTCLVQVSSRTRDFVVDALALRSSLCVLNRVTANPNVVKVLHGAESDIVWLQRDFGVYVVGLFDTYHASHVLNMQHHSLAYLLKTYCEYDADKKYQLADWRIRPIPAEMMHYARADTHFLLFVYDKMRNELLLRGRDLVGQDVGTPGAAHFGSLAGIDTVQTSLQPVELVVQRSNQTALIRYVKETYDADHGLGSGGWAPLLRKWKNPFTPVQLQVFRAVHQWRDSCAREEDESTRYVLPNHMLFTIADRMPTDVPALLAACQPTPPLLRLYATDVVRIIALAKSVAEKRVAEFKDIVGAAHKESMPDRPVHTRFDEAAATDDDDVEMDASEAVQDLPDILTPAALASAQRLMSPSSSLFGLLRDWKAKGKGASAASLKAQEIRKNLVLTVAAPVAVQTGAAAHAEEQQPFVEVKQRVREQPPVQPVVLSETYAKYRPEAVTAAPKQIKKRTDDLPRLATINLDDSASESDQDDGKAKKSHGRKRDRKKTTAAASAVAPEDVKPFEYDDGSDGQEDVLGESVVSGSSNKKKKKQKVNRSSDSQQSFNPYGQIETTKELAKRPARSRVQTKQGNRTIAFKK
ncbi:exosome nuclease subunit [Coemansia asiatica]|nr:exosome nuclease subunit [Coemansia asiatica]